MSGSIEHLTTALADRYTIERELGQGGMATVYLARDVRHGRQVAIKLLHPEISAVLGSERFLKEIDLAEAPPSATRLVTRLGQVGYPGKGVALGVVGGLFVWAAITFDPEKASGLDGALRTILDAPFGQFLLTLVALGIAAFGAYLLVRARYPERT